MLDPEELFELDQTVLAEQAPQWGRPVLVHGLAGFVDAGSGVRLATAHLLDSLPHRVVARFDLDQLLDYRSRRPTMVFSVDHFESYSTPTLLVHVLHDLEGTAFLLLTGREPDVQWERFTAAVRALVERFDVRLTVGLNAIPMGVPHTRPSGVSAHANDPELVAGRRTWFDTVRVPASAASLLELRLGEWGHQAMGYAVHVPHYLAASEYPEAARTLLQSVVDDTGLALPVDQLRAVAAHTYAAVQKQVSQSPEVLAVVQALEQQYDAFTGAEGRGSLLAGADHLPTAEEIGAELERFLAARVAPEVDPRETDEPPGQDAGA